MALNLNPLSTFTLSASTLSNLLLVTPDPIGYQPQPKSQQNEDLPTFVFTYEGINRVELSSDITDHYSEDNRALHDQIALAPEIVRVTGYIGELTSEIPPQLEGLNFIADKLEVVGQFAPQFSEAAQNALGKATQFYNSVRILEDKVVSKWVGGGDRTIQSKQQEAFAFFYGYRQQRRLFTLQTPWRIFNDMAIHNLTATQQEGEPNVSSFEIEFKKINFVNSPNLQIIDLDIASRGKNQASEVVKTGPEAPNIETETKTLFFDFTDEEGLNIVGN